MLNVFEHSSPQYPPRTYQNARLADMTVAIALDFATAGERLTHKAAGVRYLAINLAADPAHAAEDLLAVMRERHAKTLNIAGNGIYSIAPKGWTQERANAFVYGVLRKVHETWPIAKVISGGQTGIDLAGVTAAHALGIPAEATLPLGFLQRGLDNKDRPHTQLEILEQIRAGAARLHQKVAEIDHVAQRFKSQFPNPAERHQIIALMNTIVPHATVATIRQPRLYNIKRDKDIPKEALYIGRGTWRGQKSDLGNPFPIGEAGDRNAVCDMFEEWAPTRPEVMKAIEAARGRDLACYCTPYRCHGDWILKMANRELEPIAAAAPATLPIESHIQFDPQI